MGGYLVTALCINWFRFGSIQHATREYITHIFDGATFALSLLLLVGIFYETVLKLLGNTKMFLAIAGVAGVVYSVRALFLPVTVHPHRPIT
ncbi:MAG: hypothetical protein EXQ96_06215 [Alphaproteobacteria bacterium]|nr:hypothetical protein [Alphaproteobacteria bacterium]